MNTHSNHLKLTALAPRSAPGQIAGQWIADAACVYVDPEAFFPSAENGPTKAAQVRMARQVCSGCPVLHQCRDWAIESLAHGIAAGMTAQERRSEQARRAAALRMHTPLREEEAA